MCCVNSQYLTERGAQVVCDIYGSNLVLQFSVDLVLDLSCVVGFMFVHSGSRTPAIRV